MISKHFYPYLSAVVERKLRMRGQENINEILFVTTAIQLQSHIMDEVHGSVV